MSTASNTAGNLDGLMADLAWAMFAAGADGDYVLLSRDFGRDGERRRLYAIEDRARTYTADDGVIVHCLMTDWLPAGVMERALIVAHDVVMHVSEYDTRRGPDRLRKTGSG